MLLVIMIKIVCQCAHINLSNLQCIKNVIIHRHISPPLSVSLSACLSLPLLFLLSLYHSRARTHTPSTASAKELDNTATRHDAENGEWLHKSAANLTQSMASNTSCLPAVFLNVKPIITHNGTMYYKTSNISGSMPWVLKKMACGRLAIVFIKP